MRAGLFHRSNCWFYRLICAELVGILSFSTLALSHNDRPNLPLSRVIQTALLENKDLKAARLNVSIAAARLNQAGLWQNPSLNLTNTDDRFFSHAGEYTRGIGFSQNFPVGGRIGAQQQVACVDVAIAEAEVREFERKLQLDVALNYYSLVVLERRLRLINQLQANAQQLVKVTHNRLHAAEISELDANTAQLEYQRLLQEKSVLTAQRLNQTAQLNQLLGRKASTNMYFPKTIPSVKHLPSLNELQIYALQNRPDFNALWLTLNRTHAEVLLARSQRFADWTLNAAIEQNHQALDSLPSQKPSRALNLSLAIPIPLFNDGHARILEASNSSAQADAQLAARRLAIKAEVAGNYAEFKVLENSLKQAKQHLLPLSNRNLHLSKNAYTKGQISLLDVIQLQRQQSDLQTAYLNTLERYCQAWVKLKISMGKSLVSSR